MAAENIKVQASSIMPVRSSHSFVEVSYTETQTGFQTAEVPLGRSYKSVKPVALAVSLPEAATGYQPTAYFKQRADASSASICVYSPTASYVPAHVVATFECEE